MNALRKLLLPFSLIYDGITSVRNAFYNRGLFKSKGYDLPIIGVGNLSTGGTGKTPMIEYLIELLKDRKLATLSRGYGRNTSGFRWVAPTDDAGMVGDEPLQFATKHPEISVAVDENRQHGISQILAKPTPPKVILLDDVYQHRAVKPGFLILLTAYEKPFFKDYLLPAGDLRESGKGAARAQAIIVTKCPKITKAEQQEIIEKIAKYSKAPVFFSQIQYSKMVFGYSKCTLENLKQKSLTVVTGIAKPEYFTDHLKASGLNFEHLTFRDHHNFTSVEIARLSKAQTILTTEKDYMRLKNYSELKEVYYLPITKAFLENGVTLDKMVLDYVN
ncbi:MAG: tetraacyldisaccharide 4'-kinase [Leeuwenhoekiella sp.]